MTRTCVRCGKSFDAKRSDARLCSPACRQAASREARGIKQSRRQRKARAVATAPAAEPSDIGQRLAAIERRLAAIEGSAADKGGAQVAVLPKMAGLERQVRDLMREVARLTAMEARVGTLRASVAELHHGLKKVRAALAEEITARQGLEAQVVGVSQQITEFAEVMTPGWRKH